MATVCAMNMQAHTTAQARAHGVLYAPSPLTSYGPQVDTFKQLWSLTNSGVKYVPNPANQPCTHMDRVDKMTEALE